MKNILLALLSFLLVSCSNIAHKNKTNHLIKDYKKQTSGLLLLHMDTLVKPGDNFMNYVNGNWIYKSPDTALSPVVKLVKKVQNLQKQDFKKVVVERSISDSTTKNANEQKLKDMYSSYTDFSTRNQIGLQPLTNEFLKIDSITTQQKLIGYFAYAVKYALPVPITVDVTPENEVYKLVLKEGEPDTRIGTYSKSDSISQEARNAHLKHIKNMFTITGEPNAEDMVEHILFIETKLEEIQKKAVHLEVPQENKELFKIDELNLLTPGIDWTGFLAGLSLAPDSLYVDNVTYVKELAQLINVIDLKIWKAYLKWKVLETYAEYLTEPIYLEHTKHAFNNLIQETEQRGLLLLQRLFKDLISDMAFNEFFPDTIGQRAESMVSNIIEAYRLNIESSNWLDEHTKKGALEKIKKIKSIIGYQRKSYNYDKLVIKPDDLFGNIKRINAFNYNNSIAKLEKPIVDISFNPLSLNGFYMADRNTIWVAAALFNPPYFYDDAEDAINYGAIGAVIAHEIGHAFDTSGSKYDGDGKELNWWSGEDEIQFKAKTGALAEQYGTFKLKPNGLVNGRSTLGENIADLSGLTMAIKAYQLSLDGKEPKIIDGFTATQRLFIGYAQMYCNKPDDQYFINNQDSRYPPNRYRVNGVVRNIPEFYEAFQIKQEDSLYLSPDRRVKIW